MSESIKVFSDQIKIFANIATHLSEHMSSSGIGIRYTSQQRKDFDLRGERAATVVYNDPDLTDRVVTPIGYRSETNMTEGIVKAFCLYPTGTVEQLQPLSVITDEKELFRAAIEISKILACLYKKGIGVTNLNAGMIHKRGNSYVLMIDPRIGTTDNNLQVPKLFPKFYPATLAEKSKLNSSDLTYALKELFKNQGVRYSDPELSMLFENQSKGRNPHLEDFTLILEANNPYQYENIGKPNLNMKGVVSPEDLGHAVKKLSNELEQEPLEFSRTCKDRINVYSQKIARMGTDFNAIYPMIKDSLTTGILPDVFGQGSLSIEDRFTINLFLKIGTFFQLHFKDRRYDLADIDNNSLKGLIFYTSQLMIRNGDEYRELLHPVRSGKEIYAKSLYKSYYS